MKSNIIIQIQRVKQQKKKKQMNNMMGTTTSHTAMRFQVVISALVKTINPIMAVLKVYFQFSTTRKLLTQLVFRYKIMSLSGLTIKSTWNRKGSSVFDIQVTYRDISDVCHMTIGIFPFPSCRIRLFGWEHHLSQCYLKDLLTLPKNVTYYLNTYILNKITCQSFVLE